MPEVIEFVAWNFEYFPWNDVMVEKVISAESVI